MAEILLEPSSLSKIIPLSFDLNDTNASNATQLMTKRQFNTADTDAWFEVSLEGFVDTAGSFDITLFNLKDESVFNHTGKPFTTNPFYYKLDSESDETKNEIRHAGRWIGQIVVTLANGDSATRKFIFDIEGHILDGADVQTILLEDYNALIATINTSKDLLAQYNVDYAALLVDLAAAETARTATYNQLVADQQANIDAFDVALDTGIVAANLATKLRTFEETNKSRLLSTEQQLAETYKKTNQVSTFDYYGLVANDISKSSLNRTKINEAFLDIQSKGGGVLFVPTNTYYIDGGFDVPTGVTLCGMNHLTSVIQLVNPTGRYYSAVALHDSSMLKNLTLKDDETNNQQPSSVGYGGSDNPQALIQVIGKNVIIDNCNLYNSSTWCIYADDSSKTIPRRDNFTLSNSRNYWRKRSWYTVVFDVSQVFCVMDNMTFKNNKFYTDSPDFSRTVFDLAGSNIVVKGNETTNFVQSLLITYGFWVTDNLMVVQKYKVKENQFNKCKIGVMLYPSNGYTMKNIEIENNHINVDMTINSDTWDKAGSLVAGVTVEPNYKGTIQDLSIKSNVIEWTYKETILGSLELIAGIGLSNGLSGGFNLQNCDISGNTIKNFPSMGISLGSTAVGTYVTKNIKIHDNILVDNGIHNNNTNGKNPIDMVYIDYYFTHIYLVPNNMDNVDVYNNTIVDTGQTGINGVYAISWSNNHTNYKKIYVGRNTIKTNFGLGTNITRDSTAWGTNTGEPLYPTHSKLFIPDNTPIKYCKNKDTDIVNYDTEDIVITQTGLYKADKFGTTGSLDGVTFVSKKNNSIMEVSDGSKLSAGNVITWWTGTASVIGRVSYVKGNLVRLEDGSSVESTTVGETISFYNGLNATAI